MSLRVGIDGRVLGERGVGRYLKNLLAGLARVAPSDAQFTVFYGRKSDASLIPTDGRFSPFPLGRAHPAYAEQMLIPRLAKRQGLSLIHYPDNSGAVRPAMPMVLTLHDSMWARPLRQALARPSLRQRLQDHYRKWVCPRAAQGARQVLTVSDYSARDLKQRLPFLEGKLRVTCNALDPDLAGPLGDREAKERLISLGLDSGYVLCSGAADQRKNITGLMRALALAKGRSQRLDQAELLVTSLRPNELGRTQYESEARHLGIMDRVKFLGFLGDADLKALYQGALLYAFPSLWEGFGLPLLEAFALGCPVVCSDAGALPEVAGQAARLTRAGDDASLAEGLVEVADAPREHWAAKGRERLRYYSWDESARLTYKAYEDAAR